MMSQQPTARNKKERLTEGWVVLYYAKLKRDTGERHQRAHESREHACQSDISPPRASASFGFAAKGVGHDDL